MTHSMKCFEDFVIGNILSIGERTVSRDEIVAFAREFDPVPMHLDEAAARGAWHARHEVAAPGEMPAEVLLPLDGIVASNWHVGAMFMRLFFDELLVAASSRGSPGIESLDWPNPVRAGDTLRFSLEVMDIKASRSRPDLGLVLFDMLGANQRGEPVMLGRSWTMFGRREAGVPAFPANPEKRPETSPRQVVPTPVAAFGAGTGSQWFDDIEVGAVTELGAHHFSAEEIVRFARDFDPQPFHVSEAAGKASIFGGLAASGWHSAAVWQSLMATPAAAVGRDAGVPPDVLMPGVTDLRWLRPVLAGDTIAYRTTAESKVLSETNPGWGIAVSRAEGFNRRNELVFHLTARRFAKLKG